MSESPKPGNLTPIRGNSLLWLRLQLPFRLNHVNLWLIRENEGWAIVDTGIGNEATQAILQETIAGLTPARLSRVIATHYHPDHIGNAGWLSRTYNVPFHAPLTEWSYGRMISLLPDEVYLRTITHFYQRFGLPPEEVERMQAYGNHYARNVSPLPETLHRMMDGDELQLGDASWKVMTFGGHAPEHACLYCADEKILIAGDQILPFISPNISTSFFEPDSDPLSIYLASLTALRKLPADTLVLPSHGIPFSNLHLRIEQLEKHHAERLEQVLAYCKNTPRTVAELMRHLFPQDLDSHQIMFAIGEAAAHANHLVHKDQLGKTDDGIIRYCAG